MAQPQVIPSLSCPAPRLHPGAQGIERIAVDDNNAQLWVTFAAPIVLYQQMYLLNPASYSIFGGERRFPRVIGVAMETIASPPATNASKLVLSLSELGDFSIYTLTVSGPN